MKLVKYSSIAMGLVIALATLSPLSASAEQGTAAATATNISAANAVISSPQIVSELHGAVQVQGTVNVSGMHNYFLETRALNDDASIPAGDSGWAPATLPVSKPVQNGVIGSWDTTLIPDGLYELRLTVTTDNQTSVYYVVSPLRVGNASFLTATPIPAPAVTGTLTTPRITANLTSNVRSGDGIGFPVVGYLVRGTSAPILGVSSSGSGWYYIQLPDGSKGWISPSVGVVSGDASNIPTVTAPSPIIVTAVSGLLLNGIVLNPETPVCGSSFTVTVNVNNPTNATTAASTVTIQDLDVTSKTVTASATAALPALTSGANYVIVVSLTVMTYYNQPHQVQVAVADTHIVAAYTLGQGQCNISSLTPAKATPLPPTAAPATATNTMAPTAVATKAA